MGEGRGRGTGTEIDLYADPYPTVRKKGFQDTLGDSRLGRGHRVKLLSASE